MNAILRPRFAVLLALMALPFLFNSCTPYYDQAYYGEAGYSTGTTAYYGGGGYYGPAPVPVVASSLYISSSHYSCNTCRYNPCRCSKYRGYSRYHRPVVHVPTYHRCNSCKHSPCRCSKYRGRDSYNRGYSGHRGNASSHAPYSSASHGNRDRNSSSNIHRNTRPANNSSRYTTASTVMPSTRRPSAVPSRNLKPQASPRPSVTRFTTPTRTKPSSRPTSRPTASSRPTTTSRSASRPSPRPAPSSSSRSRSSGPSSSPAASQKRTRRGSNPSGRANNNGSSSRGKFRG